MNPTAQVPIAAAAIPLAAPSERVALAAALADLALDQPRPRGRLWCAFFGDPAQPSRAAIETLLGLWTLLPAAARELVLTRCGSHLRESITLPLPSDPDQRVALAAFIADAADPRLATHLRELVLDDREIIASAAETALVGLASLVPPSAGLLFELHAHLAALAHAYTDHRRRGVLQALIVAATPAAIAWPAAARPTPLSSCLEGADPGVQMALRATVRTSQGRTSLLRAWQWLGRDLGPAACIHRLQVGCTSPEWNELLRSAHLCCNPARTKRLAAALADRGTARKLKLVDPIAVLQSDSTARRGAVRLSLLTPDAQRDDLLLPFLTDPESAVRLAASDAISPARAMDLVSDPDPAVARHVGLRLEARSWASSHKPSADLFSGDEHALARARLHLHADREATIRAIRSRLQASDPGPKLGATLLLKRLNLAPDLEIDLLSLAAGLTGLGPEIPGRPSDDHRLLAAITRTLADIPTDTARTALERLMRHPADRVRASAIESVGRCNPRALADRFTEIKPDTSHRARANAAKAIIMAGLGETAQSEADELLSSMLADERPLHRMAALWGIERAALFAGVPLASETSSAVAKIARDDPEPAVRARGTRCAATLVSIVRRAWTDRVPTLAVERSPMEAA